MADELARPEADLITRPRDLTKLSDQELADRLKTFWDAYEATGLRPPGRLGINFPLLFTFRGPVRKHSRLAYLALFGLTEWGRLVFWLFALLDRGRWRLLRKDPAPKAHIILSEISDIMDEMEHRVRQRKKKQGQKWRCPTSNVFRALPHEHS